MYKTGNYIIYKEHMNLRQKPTASSKVTGAVQMGSIITVSEVSDNWGRTEIDGVSGWCCISECFARPVCDCTNSECCYFDKYNELKYKYDSLNESLNRIKGILR